MRQRWFSRRAVLLHVALLAWSPLCLLAFWWQVHRAFGGNTLSYLYSIEWPAFAVVGVWAWWGLLHTDPQTVGRRAQDRLRAAQASGASPATGNSRASGAALTTATGSPAVVVGAPGTPAPPSAAVRRRDDEDEALAAYNDRLAELATQGPKSWRRR